MFYRNLLIIAAAFFAGQFAHAPRNAISLADMIAEYLRVPARIQQFVGQWLYLQRADQSSLPPPHSLLPANNALGSDVVVGDRDGSGEGVA